MRFWLSGPRFMGIRPGISFAPPRFSSATQRSSPKVEGSFVYVVKGDHNMVKIGVTTNPAARMAQLRTASAFPISFVFIGCTPSDGYAIEREAHRMLDPYRVNREWFDVPAETAMCAVTGAASRLGQNLLVLDETTATRAVQIARSGSTATNYPFMILRALGSILLAMVLVPVLAGLVWLIVLIASDMGHSAELDFPTAVKLCAIEALASTQPSTGNMNFLLDDCPSKTRDILDRPLSQKRKVCKMLMDAWNSRADAKKEACISDEIRKIVGTQ